MLVFQAVLLNNQSASLRLMVWREVIISVGWRSLDPEEPCHLQVGDHLYCSDEPIGTANSSCWRMRRLGWSGNSRSFQIRICSLGLETATSHPLTAFSASGAEYTDPSSSFNSILIQRRPVPNRAWFSWQGHCPVAQAYDPSADGKIETMQAA